MKESIAANTGVPLELLEFVERLRKMEELPGGGIPQCFDTAMPIVVARAPGRLDVLGGVAEYSGATLLSIPTREAVLVAVQALQGGNALRLVWLKQSGVSRAFEAPLAQMQPGGRLIAFDEARAWLNARPGSGWIAPVLGPMLAMLHQKELPFPGGVTIFIQSTLPEGSGAGEAPALGVAVLQALSVLLEIPLKGLDMARLVQSGTQQLTGAAQGLVEPLTASTGNEDELLAVKCQPGKVESAFRIPESLALWGITTGETTEAHEAQKLKVRIAAFMGYRIMAELSELPWKYSFDSSHAIVDDVRWHGYLANVSPLAYEAEFRKSLAESMGGRAFLDRYRANCDPCTKVDPEGNYPVRPATELPIYENARVKRFRSLIGLEPNEDNLSRMGELMHASHEHYRRCGLVSPGADTLVALSRAAGPARHLFGARLMGWGGGGTVLVLGRKTARAEEAVAAIVREFATAAGHTPHVFQGSSPGAEAVGFLRFRL
ncbi:MAG: hypothetical protein HYV27_23545 [Candidatus Hydrogenedentes bacterium]|nr:hypothetical protein [Candidatus Hydrogenedentota bacterium]